MNKEQRKINFINSAKLLFPLYDYSLVEYVNNKTKVKIICPEHGIFEQTPHNHIDKKSKCPKCALIQRSNKRANTTETFIEKAKEIHGTTYDYSLTQYKNAYTKVKIICPEHGIFEQRPYAHVFEKQGCFMCYNVLRKEIAPSWTVTNWLNAANRSNRFDSFKLYVIRCFNDNESFIKIGRTFCTLNVRFNQLPYNYEVAKVITNNDGKYIYDLETRIKHKFKKHKYTPKIKFGGMNECYKIIP
jgi:hypothetical protein